MTVESLGLEPKKVRFNLSSPMKMILQFSFSLMFVLQCFVIGVADARTINVAYPSPSWNTSLPVSMAKEFGLFTAEGLEV